MPVTSGRASMTQQANKLRSSAPCLRRSHIPPPPPPPPPPLPPPHHPPPPPPPSLPLSRTRENHNSVRAQGEALGSRHQMVLGGRPTCLLPSFQVSAPELQIFSLLSSRCGGAPTPLLLCL